MDEADELVPQPDKRGFLDLTNRAWIVLDPVIWTMTLSLVSLDISYNHIAELPSQIGDLVVLRELRASFNKIVHLPPDIGRLKRLKKLIMNGNRIQSLPDEIGRLEGLEELILSENAIESIPSTISNMGSLRILKLQSNRIRKLPFEIADVFTLEVLDCSNNKKLDMIPPSWLGDTEGILFILKIHRDYHTMMSEMRTTNGDLGKHSQYLEHEQLVMKEAIGDMRLKMEEVRKHIPKKILRRLEREGVYEVEGAADTEEGGCRCTVS